MVDQISVDMIVRAITAGFEKMSADLQAAGKAAEGTGEGAQKATLPWTELASKVSIATTVAKGFIAVGREILEFGREGAVFAQTQESFDGLLERLRIAPDVLQEMREATLGTVDDLTLMSSTLTLVAGSSEETTRAMIEAAPQLLEIAKAANKLNPALGDTTFFYESLAKGIKRASPLILDNLGIVIKVEEATSKYAETLGKTADSLTAEERTMAILNGVLEAGVRLQEQAGAGADSATDSYDRMSASLKNLADSYKAQLAPAIGKAAEAIDNYATAQMEIQTAGETLRRAEELGIITLDEALDMTNAMIRGRMEAAVITAKYTDQINILSDETAKGEFQARMAAVAQAELNEAMAAGEGEADRLAQEMDNLQLLLAGPVGKEYENFIAKNEELRAKAEELRAKIAELEAQEYLTEAQQEELAQLRLELDENSAAFAANAAAHDEATKRILFNMLQQQAAADGLTQAEVDGLIQTARHWGLLDEATARSAELTAAAWKRFMEDGNLAAYLASLEEIKALTDGIPPVIETHWILRTSIHGRLPPKPGGGEWPIPEQLGGLGLAGYTHLIGERGPELFVPPINGTVINNNMVNDLIHALRQGRGSAGGENKSFIVENLQISVPAGVNGQMFARDFMAQLETMIKAARSSGSAYIG